MELIKVTTRNDQQVVSARELYIGLGYDITHYSRWCKNSITDNKYFEENEDWVSIAIDGERSESRSYNPNQPKDYALSITMAKKLAMMAKTEIGDKYRDYFIACEKKAQEKQSVSLPQTYLEALKALVVVEEQRLALQEENDVMRPKAEYFDELVDRKLNTNFRDTAKELGVKQNEFIKWLTDSGYIYRNRKDEIRHYSKHSDLFAIKEYANKSHSSIQTLITPKGRATFRLLLKK